MSDDKKLDLAAAEAKLAAAEIDHRADWAEVNAKLAEAEKRAEAMFRPDDGRVPRSDFDNAMAMLAASESTAENDGAATIAYEFVAHRHLDAVIAAALATDAGRDWVRREEVERLQKMLRECAINDCNPDTCGVCGEHFLECEIPKYVTDGSDPPFDASTPMTFACAGARARAALAEGKVGR